MAAWMLLQLRLSVFDGQDGVLRSKTPMPKSAMEGGFWHAQGIEAVSFFAIGKKDTSVKPGPRAVLPGGQAGARMRPKQNFCVYPGKSTPRAYAY
jgi:hypothetical protein